MELVAKLQEQRREAVAAKTHDAYAAFHAVDRRLACLQLRPVGQCWQDVAYHHLLRVIRDVDNSGKALTIVFTSIAVIVRGGLMQEIADAVASHHCQFIRQYSPKLWQEPADLSKPVVTAMEYVTQQNAITRLLERGME